MESGVKNSRIDQMTNSTIARVKTKWHTVESCDFASIHSVHASCLRMCELFNFAIVFLPIRIYISKASKNLGNVKIFLENPSLKRIKNINSDNYRVKYAADTHSDV